MTNSISKIDAERLAKEDLARRLGAAVSDVATQSVEDDEFSNASLGAAEEDEMSAQVITDGWRILLSHRSRTYEYRANSYQLRLVAFEGKNYRVYP